MKTISLRTGLTLLGLAFFLPGCLDIYLTTQLFPNGEIEKTIVIKGDSTSIPNTPFYFMRDSGWTKKWIQGDDNKPNLVLTKKFRSCKELNKVMNPADSTIQTVRVQSELKRKFRWFFTYFDYSETIYRTDPYKTLDWHDYLSEKELRLVKISDEEKLKTDPEYDSLEYKKTDKKLEEFVTRSAAEDYYRILMSILAKEPGYTAEINLLRTRKEEFFRFMIDSTGDSDGPEILEAVGKFCDRPGMTALGEKYPESFKLFDDKMEFWANVGSNSFKFIIRMPGILLKTNSTQVQGLETRWELTSDEIYFEDTILTCESRVINRWAFYVAGIIILIALAGLAGSIRLRKRRAAAP